jgi:hypothetical protein
MAFLWLASGDNRDAGEPRQRFAAALTFFQLNGTIWDFNDEWMGELNECLWMGIQCNNRDTVNSLAVDTNNLFGKVRNKAIVIFIRIGVVSVVVACDSSPPKLHSRYPRNLDVFTVWQVFL